MIIKSRAKDIGGFSVRRILPYASKRMVGPFIFFDHMGPANLAAGTGMDVRPHPHINLATVTYLFEGKIQHRDSLGSNQVIEPGAINWMTAGKGIVHSERSPEKERVNDSKVHGIQLWVALPEANEECEPSFIHYPKESLPEFQINQCSVKLLVGSLFDYTSPVHTHSDLFYAEVRIKKGKELSVPVGKKEAAIYLVEGKLLHEKQEINSTEMLIHEGSNEFVVRAVEDSHIMLIGGSPVGSRYIFWNFVSSSKERIEQAKKLWAQGPHSNSSRFLLIPGDDQEFIPLPEDNKNIKGTPM